MMTQVIGTVLALIAFMVAFTYFLNTLFFRQIEKKDKQTKKDAQHHDRH